jgi:thiol:disulfide interchange protein
MIRLALRSALNAAVACAAAASVVQAQEHPIQFTMRMPDQKTVRRPGDTLSVFLHAQIPPGWHLYSITQTPGGPIPTSIEIGPPSLARMAGTIDAPVPLLAPDPNFNIVTEWHEDSAVFRVPIRLSRSARAGNHTIEARIGYQTCTDRYCLPPTEDTVTHAILVAGAALAGADPDVIEPPPAPAKAVIPPPALNPAADVAQPVNAQSGSRSFGLFLWLAATMGALSLLTPCVFPMVPITISYFGQGNQRSRARAVGDAVLYAGGIIGAFTGLGLGLSLVFGVAGLNRFAASPWLNLGIAALFVAFALSLFGVLHLAVPSRLLNWLDRSARGSRAGRVGTTLLMGVTFALTTFTCTAPFVGTLLVTAARGDWRWPLAGLAAFSAVFALPFMLLALLPHALTRLPRSGEWLGTMKGSLAFIELAAALKFLSNADLVEGWGIFTRQTVVALWVVLAGMLTAYLLGVRVHQLRIRRPAKLHKAAAFAALVVTVFLTTGLTGRRLGELESFLPPAGSNRDGVGGAGELSWLLDDYPGALRLAAEEKKLVLIDFTGYTCTNCRWMEANMFPRPDVVRELRQFVRVRLFTDGRGEQYRRQQALEQEKFQTVALPLYAVVDSLGRPRATFLGMTRDTREFVEFLSSARSTRAVLTKPTSLLVEVP